MASEPVHVDQLLATIWQEALNVPGVRNNDDFFDLGGNSLQAIQIVSRVRDVLGLELPITVLERASMFADFVDHVAAVLREQASSVSDRQATGSPSSLLRTSR